MAASNTLLALHGFSQNAEVLQASLEPLARELLPHIKIVCLNGPHVCSESSVEKLYQVLPGKRLPGPHLSWWDATADGLDYRGLDESLAVLREAEDRYSPIGVLGFSQGAIFAAMVAALSQTGEYPAVHKLVLIAGRTPRTSRVQHALRTPIRVPSLHVWGERDLLVRDFGQALADHFDAAQRQIVIWPGGHRIPQSGPAHDRMVQFLNA